jgi:hypothetical protein
MSVILLFLLFILLPLNDNNNNKHNKPIYINETTILNEQYAIKPDTLIYFDDSDISKSANITLLDCQKISDAYGGSTNFIINDDHFITFGFLISPTMNFYLSAINNSFCNININNENAFNSDTPFFAFAVGSLSKFDGVFRGNINIDKSVKIYINNIISDETFILSATFCVFYFNSIGSHSLIDIKGIFNIHSTSINIYGIYIANTIEKDSVQNINGCFKCVSNYDASTMRTIYNDELLTSLKQERAIFNLSSCIFINQSFGLTNINGIFFIKGYEGSIAHVKKMGVTAKFNMNGIFNILSTIGNVAGVIFGDFQNLDNILDGQISIGGIFSIECSLNGGCSSAIHIVNRTQKT